MRALDQICGLDFGTSNSEIGIVKSGHAVLVDVEDMRTKIPSTIFFDYDDGVDVFGEAAIERFLAGSHGRIMWSIKSILGTSLMAGDTVVRGRRVAFEDVITRILGNLKRRAEIAAGRELADVVLGRPVHFSDSNPELDRAAENTLRRSAAACGFRNIAMELEPVAAGIEFETHLDRELVGLVVDIGGGTSDFSVIRLTPTAQHQRVAEPRQILAVAGIHIGGTDFDRQLSISRLMPELGLGSSYSGHGGELLPMPQWIFHDLASWLRINFIYDSRMLDGIFTIINQRDEDSRHLRRLERVLTSHLGHKLARLVEAAKIELSNHDAVRIGLGFVEAGLDIPVTRKDLNCAIAALLDETERVILEAIRDSGVPKEAIAVVFFAGGGSLLPEVRTRVNRLLPEARQVETDQFGGIALGLTIQAARVYCGKSVAPRSPL
ncbi:MAG: Hsp70 family protein [Thermoanaerobaculia bacterium]